MKEQDILRKLTTEPFFINLRLFEYDLRKLEAKYDTEPCPDHKIAQALHVSEEALDSWYHRVIGDIQALMEVDEDGPIERSADH